MRAEFLPVCSVAASLMSKEAEGQLQPADGDGSTARERFLRECEKKESVYRTAKSLTEKYRVQRWLWSMCRNRKN